MTDGVDTVVHRSGIHTTPGDGSWIEEQCGCKHAVGRDGELGVICCEKHSVAWAIEAAREAHGL